MSKGGPKTRDRRVLRSADIDGTDSHSTYRNSCESSIEKDEIAYPGDAPVRR